MSTEQRTGFKNSIQLIPDSAFAALTNAENRLAHWADRLVLYGDAQYSDKTTIIEQINSLTTELKCIRRAIGR